jgi:hypothetical protein
MRMELHKAEITRSNRLVTGYIVAPEEQRAREVLVEHEIALNQENDGFTLERVDETLPDDQHLGLEALLEHAPVGFASFCEGIGWLAHMAPVPQLRLFRIEEVKGDHHFLVAPNFDKAADVYCEVVPLAHDEARLFRIHDGLLGLKNEALRGLPALLEVGPIGIVEWDDERGWSIKGG